MNAWITGALLAGLCAFTNAAAQDKLQGARTSATRSLPSL